MHDAILSAWVVTDVMRGCCIVVHSSCCRALSLPAALSMNVCQAAFRSLLDLTTPFCVVMLANLANFVLDNVLMFQLGWGMAGCGWASVISQVRMASHLYLNGCVTAYGGVLVAAHLGTAG